MEGKPKKAERSVFKQCFYCDNVFASDPHAQGDHMPIPERYGGELTVPCCQSCHTLKDRIPLKDWPEELVRKTLDDFPKLNRETRIFIAKAMFLWCDAVAVIDSDEATDERKR